MLKFQSTFQKSVTALLLFLLPILIVSTIIFNHYTTFMNNYLVENAALPVAGMVNQTDAQVDNAELFASSILRDTNMKELEYYAINPSSYTSIELLTFYKNIRDRLNALVPISGSHVYYTVFTPTAHVISVNAPFIVSYSDFPREYCAVWTHQHRLDGDRVMQGYFIKHFSQMAYSGALPSSSKNLVEVAISERWLMDLFASASTSSTRSLLYLDSGEIIAPDGQADTVRDTLDKIASQQPELPEYTVMDGYLFTFRRCDVLGGYYAQYQDVAVVFGPLNAVRNTFVIALLLMSLFAIFAIWYLYRSISLPFKELKQAFDEMGAGNYKVRIGRQYRNEFEEAMDKFNQMANNIDQLVNHVYEEQLRTQEATFKQYQAQINPHFLYNCLFFIKNMAALEDYESIEKISLHLAAYYRYITRVDESTTTLSDELAFVDNYLSIMSMRIARFNYHMDILPDMLSLKIPKLLIQPIVENAVVHGVEQSESECTITITALSDNDRCVICVENSGAILAEETLEQLRRITTQTTPKKKGYGLWNLSQRIRLFFGDDATLDFSVGDSSGLVVTISFPMNYERKN